MWLLSRKERKSVTRSWGSGVLSGLPIGLFPFISRSERRLVFGILSLGRSGSEGPRDNVTSSDNFVPELARTALLVSHDVQTIVDLVLVNLGTSSAERNKRRQSCGVSMAIARQSRHTDNIG